MRSVVAPDIITIWDAAGQKQQKSFKEGTTDEIFPLEPNKGTRIRTTLHNIARKPARDILRGRIIFIILQQQTIIAEWLRPQ